MRRLFNKIVNRNSNVKLFFVYLFCYFMSFFVHKIASKMLLALTIDTKIELESDRDKISLGIGNQTLSPILLSRICYIQLLKMVNAKAPIGIKIKHILKLKHLREPVETKYLQHDSSQYIFRIGNRIGPESNNTGKLSIKIMRKPLPPELVAT